jgi:hypothetical protein
MADITYSINVNVGAGGFVQNLFATGVTSDFATAGLIAVTLNLGTATQAVSTASASSLGLCFARSLNTTTTHTVSFGRLSGTTLFETVRLNGGDAALLRLAPGNYAAKSVAAGGRLVLQILED